MRSGWLALGVLAGVGLGASASAQTFTPPAAGAGRHYDVKFSTNVTYDSNITRTARNVGLRALSTEDEIINPSLYFDVVQPVGRQVLFLNGAAGYDFHLQPENRRLNRENVDLTGGGAAQLFRCQVMAEGRYAAAQSDLADVLLGVVTNTVTSTSGGGSVGCQLFRGLTAEVSGNHEDTNNSAAVQSIANHSTDSVSLGLSYNLSGFGQIGLSGAYVHADYPNRLLFNGDRGDSFENTSYSVTYSRHFGSRIGVEVGIGEAFVSRKVAPPGFPKSTSGLNYNAVINYQATPRLSFDLIGARAYHPANQPGQLVVLSTTTDLRARYTLSDRLGVSLGGTYFESDASSDQTLLSSLAPTRIRRTSVNGGANYRLGRRISLGLNVRHDDNQTNLPAFNYSAVRATLSLNITLL